MQTPPQPEPITATVSLPLFLPTGTPAPATDDAGLSVTVAPVPYALVPQTLESADDLGEHLQAGFTPNGALVETGTRDVRITRATLPVVCPDRVAFIVTVVNCSPRPFVGRGAKLRFLIPGHPPTPADGLGLAAVAVPPGGEDHVTVFGPRLSELQPGTAVGLQLAGLPAAAIGVPRRPINYWYSYATDDRSCSTDPIVIDRNPPVGSPVVTITER